MILSKELLSTNIFPSFELTPKYQDGLNGWQLPTLVHPWVSNDGDCRRVVAHKKLGYSMNSDNRTWMQWYFFEEPSLIYVQWP